MDKRAGKIKDEFWQVVRQDTHGTRYVYDRPGVKSTHLTKEEADELVRELEKKHGGHKQDFFSERMKPK
jgi:hypothetical protein